MCGVRVAAVMLILGTSYYPELSPHFWTLSPLVSSASSKFILPLVQ